MSARREKREGERGGGREGASERASERSVCVRVCLSLERRNSTISLIWRHVVLLATDAAPLEKNMWRPADVEGTAAEYVVGERHKSGYAAGYRTCVFDAHPLARGDCTEVAGMLKEAALGSNPDSNFPCSEKADSNLPFWNLLASSKGGEV